jgi:hypothetical protein
MATIRWAWMSPRSWGFRHSRVDTTESAKARRVVHDAYTKSGGPTPELKRVYGEYLKYKRAKIREAKD